MTSLIFSDLNQNPALLNNKNNLNNPNLTKKPVIGIIGLGYVGLPLAVAFSQYFNVIGFDIDQTRIIELKQYIDTTLELSSDELRAAHTIQYTFESDDLIHCTIYIVTVPTPIDTEQQPDLIPLESATIMISRYLKPGDIVIFESTVYPGTTEEICVPILEKNSGLVFNQDFYCGYSPERINPGDSERKLATIKKITSGSTPEIAVFIDQLYQTIITAGTYLAGSIKIAEAAKVIENIQRDVNIALINELAMIFNKLNLDTQDILQAAGTKWNFLPFKPGLVGGHCIGVDPYYLLHKSKSVGYLPKLIQTAREINNDVASHIVQRVINGLNKNNIEINKARILILGITFKENCPDLRNSKVIEIIKQFSDAGANITVVDPWANPEEVKQLFTIELEHPHGMYDGIILTVAHHQFCVYSREDIHAFSHENSFIYDVKSVWARDWVNERL